MSDREIARAHANEMAEHDLHQSTEMLQDAHTKYAAAMADLELARSYWRRTKRLAGLSVVVLALAAVLLIAGIARGAARGATGVVVLAALLFVVWRVLRMLRHSLQPRRPGYVERQPDASSRGPWATRH